jgi:hypothetical protein
MQFGKLKGAVMWPFTKRKSVEYWKGYIAEQQSRVELENAREDRLFDEWADGPGKEWPTHTVMMRDIEGAEPKPTEMWADGWIPAFHAWAKEQP